MKSREASPTLKEIELYICKLPEKYPGLVKTEIIGYSKEKRPVWVVKITDSKVSEENKQNVLIAGGHHGSEESGRVSCLGLIEWLLTKEAKEVRRTQQIIIVPSANPDGAFYNTRYNRSNIDLGWDYFLKTGPKAPETKAIAALADRYQPDVVVDVHGLAGGTVNEMVNTVPTREYSTDERVFKLIAEEMKSGAEKKGYPMDGHSMSWNGWYDRDQKEGIGYMITYCYRKYHSIGFLTESNESPSFSISDMKKSGSARLIALLKTGLKKYPFEYYKGYPTGVIAGSQFLSITDLGKTAGERRKSRPGLLSNLDYFHFGRKNPEKKGEIEINLDYKGKTLDTGLGFRCRVRGKVKLKKVLYGAKVLAVSEKDGYVTWKDSCSTYIQINIPVLSARKRSFTIKY